MSHRKHRRQKVKEFTTDYFGPQRTANNQFQGKRSLGALRKNKKTKPQSPDATGKFHFQRHTLKKFTASLRTAMMKLSATLPVGETAISMVHISPLRFR